MVKAILFDWGGVLTQGRYRDSIIRLIDSRYKTQIALKRSFIGKLMDKMDSNTLEFDDFTKKINKKFEINISVDEMDEIFRKAILPANSELIDIIKKLKNKYRVVLASNNNPKTVSIVRAKYEELLNLFEKTYFSFEIGLCKPDKEFFLYILRDLGLDRENVLFIDDKLENVQSAKKIGMKSIQFESSTQIIKELSKLI